MTKYPRDEFDEVAENAARHGVHRSTQDVKSRSLVPIMVVGVVALLIGLLAFLVLPKLLDTAQSPQGGATAPAPAPASTAPATSEAPSPTPTAAPTPTPSEEPTPSPTPEAVPDKSVPVAVYNAAGVPGLAAQYAGTVTTDGWTVSQSANWAGQPQASSVIFYNGPDQLVNAKALSTLLNIPTIADTNALGIPLAVVLGPGA